MRRSPLRSLVRKQDFESVFREGVSAATPLLVLYARTNGLGDDRLGLSVSKKIGKAVTRNRIKRLLREAMRTLTAARTLHYDFILIARKPAPGGTLDDFIHDIEKCLREIGIKADTLPGGRA